MGFTKRAEQKIVETVQWKERLLRNPDTERGRWMAGDEPYHQWFALDEHLAAGGTAEAHAVKWAKPDAAYTVDDDGDAVTVQDTVSQHWGLEYEWVRCRPVGSSSGTVWEVVEGGAPWHRGLIYDEVCRDESVTVYLTVRGEAVEVTAWNVFSGEGSCLSPGSDGLRVGISYNVDHLDDYGEPDPRWELTEAECA